MTTGLETSPNSSEFGFSHGLNFMFEPVCFVMPFLHAQWDTYDDSERYDSSPSTRESD